MPESKYDYKPVPEVRTFREQLTHLISENYNYMSMIAGDPPPDRGKYDALKGRDEILKSYPSLQPEHIDAAIAYAAELAREESLLPLVVL